MTPVDIERLARDIATTTQSSPPKAVVYRRIDQRQRELFRMAAEIDSEFYGACGTITVRQTGPIAVNLSASFPEGDVGQVDLVRVKALGTYQNPNRADDNYDERVEVGDEITICSAYDAPAHLPPRATIRDGVLAPIDTDFGLENQRFGELEVFYQRLPRSISDDEDVDLAKPWDMLLVWDAARFMVARAPEAEAQRVIAMAKTEEAELLAQYRQHVASWSGVARSARFEGGA